MFDQLTKQENGRILYILYVLLNKKQQIRFLLTQRTYTTSALTTT